MLIAQIALNNNAFKITGITLFYANFRKYPNLFMEPQEGLNANVALQDIEDLVAVHNRIRRKIINSQETLTKSRHKDSKTAPQLKVGDRVYLLTKNLRTKRRSKKLDYVKVGPFSIAEVKGPVNYRLQLPADTKVYPVFYISLLELANANIPV